MNSIPLSIRLPRTSAAVLAAGAATLAIVLALCSHPAPASSSQPDVAFDGAAPIAPYIIGGSESSIGQFPWQVLVVGLHESAGEIIETSCGGSILDSTHILTAAHCVDHKETTNRYEANEFVVLAGASDVREFKEDLFFKGIEPPPGAQAALVAGIRTHPYYVTSPTEIKDDVAVLSLASPLELSASKDTASIPLVANGATPSPGTILSVSGYGKEQGAESAGATGKLDSTNLSVSAGSSCQALVKSNAPVLLCVEGAASSTCQGDSGSPLTEGSPPVQVGIVDFGIAGCPIGRPEASTNIAAGEVRDFIEGSESPPVAPREVSPPAVKWFGGAPVAFVPLTCESGSWSGSPSISYTFQLENASAQLLQNGPANVFAPAGPLVGSTVVCVVQASNAGGTSTARSQTTSAIVADTVPPNAAIGSLRCHLQSCVLRYTAWDPNGVAVSAQSTVAYSVTARCPKKKGKHGAGKRVCHTTKTSRLSVKTLSAGSFRANAFRLPYGERLTFAVTVLNAAGLKGKIVNADTTLRKPKPKTKKRTKR